MPTPPLAMPPVRWTRSAQTVLYPDAEREMEREVQHIQQGGSERVWLLEHPPLYTAGTSAKPSDLIAHDRFPVFPSPRGGQYTYHGPGQRVAYVMLDLGRRTKDVRKFVHNVERWVILALAELGVEAGPREGRVGVWVNRGDGREDKIAAIGVRIRKWVTFHGVSINVSPDLEHFSGIVPCGIDDARFGVTSLEALGVTTDMNAVDDALRAAFEEVFGPTVEAAAE
ncbi:MAG: lipoyl(octanoyl) transferase LipB [Pseudomonadota bacterium]